MCESLKSGDEGALYSALLMIRIAFFCSIVSLCKWFLVVVCQKLTPYVRCGAISA